jgi:hypothetical protein
MVSYAELMGAFVRPFLKIKGYPARLIEEAISSQQKPTRKVGGLAVKFVMLILLVVGLALQQSRAKVSVEGPLSAEATG